jgi:hypothetical protein
MVTSFFSLLFVCLFIWFWARVLLYRQAGPQACHPPASVSQVLGLQVWTTMSCFLPNGDILQCCSKMLKLRNWHWDITVHWTRDIILFYHFLDIGVCRVILCIDLCKDYHNEDADCSVTMKELHTTFLYSHSPFLPLSWQLWLDLKCPPKAHVLKSWSPAGGTVKRWWKL